MAFYASKRKLRPKEEEEVGELNIVPYLDILMNLIIFMLLSMTGLAVFGIVNVNAPNYGGAGAAAANPEQPERAPLNLNVSISNDGFIVAGSGAVLGGGGEGGGPTIPRKADRSYDFQALNDKMKEIRANFPVDKYPDETKVIIAADPKVAYEVLIGTMDATRETMDEKKLRLFPDVTLATF